MKERARVRLGREMEKKGAGLALSRAELGRVGNDHQDPQKENEKWKKQKHT